MKSLLNEPWFFGAYTKNGIPSLEGMMLMAVNSDRDALMDWDAVISDLYAKNPKTAREMLVRDVEETYHDIADDVVKLNRVARSGLSPESIGFIRVVIGYIDWAVLADGLLVLTDEYGKNKENKEE